MMAVSHKINIGGVISPPREGRNEWWYGKMRALKCGDKGVWEVYNNCMSRWDPPNR